MARPHHPILSKWFERHQTRVSLWLHAVGIPLAIAAVCLAIYQLWLWRWDLWWRPAILLVAGYLLQIIGHLYEGNDVGEWILIKRILGLPYVAVAPRFAKQAPLTQCRSVAVVGASNDRSKFGNKSVRAHAKHGWTVYPVNPAGGEIEGHKAYRSLADIPVPLDRVTLYVPPELGVKLLDSIARAQPKEFFVNPGAESDELVAQARTMDLHPILACSIVALGEAPASFPD